MHPLLANELRLQVVVWHDTDTHVCVTETCLDVNQTCQLHWLIDWLIDQLIDWFVDWFVDWLVGWLVFWFGLVIWLVCWLVDWLTGWLTDWLVGWLAGCLTLAVCLWQANSSWLTLAGWLWLTVIPQSPHTPGPRTGCSPTVLNKNRTSIHGPIWAPLAPYKFCLPIRTHRLSMHAL